MVNIVFEIDCKVFKTYADLISKAYISTYDQLRSIRCCYDQLFTCVDSAGMHSR